MSVAQIRPAPPPCTDVPLPSEIAVELLAFARLMLTATSGGRFELHFAPGGDLTVWKAERSGKVARRPVR